MKITYDPKIDAMYIKFQDGTFVSNKESGDGIIFDMGKKGIILGIEILEASKRLKSKTSSHLDIQIPFFSTMTETK